MESEFAELLQQVATACFWCVHEWVIHAKLLHSEEAWYGKHVHQLHHDLPSRRSRAV